MMENQHRSKVIIWGNPDQLGLSSQIQDKETAMFLSGLTLLVQGKYVLSLGSGLSIAQTSIGMGFGFLSLKLWLH